MELFLRAPVLIRELNQLPYSPHIENIVDTLFLFDSFDTFIYV